MLINMLRQQKHKHWRRMLKYFFILIFISFSSRNGVCSVIAIRHLNAKYLFIFGVGSVRDGGNFFFCFSRSLYSFLRLFFVCVSFCSSIIMKELLWWTKYTRGIATKMQISFGFFLCIPPEKNNKNEEVFKIIFCMRIFWMFRWRGNNCEYSCNRSAFFLGKWVKII